MTAIIDMLKKGERFHDVQAAAKTAPAASGQNARDRGRQSPMWPPSDHMEVGRGQVEPGVHLRELNRCGRTGAIRVDKRQHLSPDCR